MSTEDIPYLGSTAGGTSAGSKGAVGVGVGAAPVPLFDPVVVELNATILLRFLQVLFCTGTKQRAVKCFMLSWCLAVGRRADENRWAGITECGTNTTVDYFQDRC